MIDVGDLLALNPSICSPGAAVFRDGRLIAATRVRVTPAPGLNASERCLVAADAVAKWVTEQEARPIALAHEWPQIYAAAKSKGNPNDLIYMAGVNLALVAAYSIAAARRNVQLRVLCYLPAEWIGQLPKSTRGSAKSSPRAQRILSRLEPDEADVLPDQHDAIDAVGIGLHALGRLGVRRALASGL